MASPSTYPPFHPLGVATEIPSPRRLARFPESFLLRNRKIQGPTTTSSRLAAIVFRSPRSDHPYVKYSTPVKPDWRPTIPYMGSFHFQAARGTTKERQSFTHPFSGIISVAESQNSRTGRDVQTPPRGHSPWKSFTLIIRLTGSPYLRTQAHSTPRPLTEHARNVDALLNRKIKSPNAISRLPAAVLLAAPFHTEIIGGSWDVDPFILCHDGTHCPVSLFTSRARRLPRIIRASLDPRQVARGTPIRLYFDIPCRHSVSEKDHGMRAAPLAAVWFTEDAHGMGMPRRPLRHPTEGPVDALGYPSALDIATPGP
ncbi:hypothetical protein DFP72DRAFT_1108160 [Ephemerocybe angulata]|uniref:Uncharacterized protein n=1 Tax=Ephemerocybe angulata TaxID=980116 RepID=A0A8H6II87_9AGAR|nr:hypothetical protein DFP72DRAFT_1108160 [Tulosesus angulatus]